MKNFYFTFGYGTENRDNYVKIAAKNYSVARVEMTRVHGLRWAMQYEEEEFLPQIRKYGLKEIPL